MTTRFSTAVLLAALVMCGTAAMSRAEGLNIIPLGEVPQDVRLSIEAAAPNVKWLVCKQMSDGYVMLGREIDGQQRLVEGIKPTGQGAYVRVRVETRDVPVAVTTALAAKVPDFTIESAQLTGLSTQKIIGYRFIGKRANGQVGAVVVSLDGGKVIEE